MKKANNATKRRALVSREQRIFELRQRLVILREMERWLKAMPVILTTDEERDSISHSKLSNHSISKHGTGVMAPPLPPHPR